MQKVWYNLLVLAKGRVFEGPLDMHWELELVEKLVQGIEQFAVVPRLKLQAIISCLHPAILHSFL